MTSWSKTIKNLGRNIVAGLDDREFYCPVFGVKHKIEKSHEMDTEGNVFVIPYRGYNYFVRRVFQTDGKVVGWSFGLVYTKKSTLDVTAVYSKVMLISPELTHVMYYDPSGRAETNASR